jgi:hypothetical protein
LFVEFGTVDPFLEPRACLSRAISLKMRASVSYFPSAALRRPGLLFDGEPMELT